MSNGNKPLSRVTMAPVTVTIWANKNSKGEVFHNFTIERSYRADDGNWNGTSTFGLSDLLLVAKVADLAHTESYKLRAKDRQAAETEK